MAKSRAEKEASLALIRERLQSASSAVLTDFRGLDVAKATELRRRLRRAGVDYRVLKNTLLRRAAAELGVAGLEPYLEGPTAVAFSLGDPTVGPREVQAFGREHPELQIKAGLLDRQVIGPERVRALADLPSREVLLARTAAAFASPLTALATVLAAPLRSLAVAVDALRQKREAGAA